MYKLDMPLFIKQLKQVITWTDILSHEFDFENGFYGTVFRKTNPYINNVPLYLFDNDYATWNVDACNIDNYKQALEAAIATRNASLIHRSNLNARGKILCFEIGFTTNDGIAIVESNCFFDESDVPPIDTWFYIDEQKHFNAHRGTLFCWIPSAFQDVAQRGIDIEMMKSYYWLNEINPNMNNDIFRLIFD